MNLDKFSDQLQELGYANSGERYKLVGLYAYNEFYDADKDRASEVNDGVVVSSNFPIDGIFLNQKDDEDTVEIDVAYCLSSPSEFKIKDITNYVSRIANFISNVKSRKFTSGNNKAEEILREYLNPDQGEKIPPFCIRILTNVDLNENDTYQTRTTIERINPDVKGVDISIAITFGQDIESTIQSNIAPFDYVKEGTLALDKRGNTLTYSENAIVTNISARSLKDLWKKEGKRGLLAMNLRYYIKNGNIDSKIENSITNDYGNFWYLNNGVIIVCDSYEINDNQLKLKNFSIVNGGQTTRMIGEIPFENDFYILAKIVKSPEETGEKNLFVSKVAEASNTQKPIKAKDVIANRVEQRNLKSDLGNAGIFIEIKRGEKPAKAIYPEAWQKTKNNELAQDLYAFVFLQPGPARNNVSKILQDEKKYSLIFQKHHYSTAFLKDLLFLEKAYRKYITKKTGKNSPQIDPEYAGLIKNGMYYCLAIIGYILKTIYCPAYEEALHRYKMTTKKDSIQGEQAFDCSFIDQNLSFSTFEGTAFKLFDYVITKLMHPLFRDARSAKPELAYSNWTKTNTGFSAIIDRIESEREYGDNYHAKAFATFFLTPNSDQVEENNKLFTQNTKSVLNEENESNNSDDKGLRDDLMLLRLKCSQENYISEKKVMSDKALNDIVSKKPTTKEELKEIVSATALYYIGDKIIELVLKNVK